MLMDLLLMEVLLFGVIFFCLSSARLHIPRSLTLGSSRQKTLAAAALAITRVAATGTCLRTTGDVTLDDTFLRYVEEIGSGTVALVDGDMARCVCPGPRLKIILCHSGVSRGPTAPLEYTALQATSGFTASHMPIVQLQSTVTYASTTSRSLNVLPVSSRPTVSNTPIAPSSFAPDMSTETHTQTATITQPVPTASQSEFSITHDAPHTSFIPLSPRRSLTSAVPVKPTELNVPPASFTFLPLHAPVAVQPSRPGSTASLASGVSNTIIVPFASSVSHAQGLPSEEPKEMTVSTAPKALPTKGYEPSETYLPHSSPNCFRDRAITILVEMDEGCDSLPEPPTGERAVFMRIRSRKSGTVELWHSEAQLDGVPQKWVRSSNESALTVAWRKWPSYEGQDLILSAFDIAPYVYVERRDGVELLLVKEAAASLNLRLKVKVPPGDDLIGFFNTSSRSWQGGVLGAVESGFADVAVAALFFNENDYYRFQMVAPWTWACLTFLAPRPISTTSVRTILRPFATKVWVALAVSLLLQAAAIAVARKMRPGLCWRARTRTGCCARATESLGVSLLQMFGMLLQTAAPASESLHPTQRHLLACWSIFSMLVVTAFCSSLVAHLTAPVYPRPLETIRDLVRGGFIWGYYIPLPLEFIFDFSDVWQRQFANRMVLVRSSFELSERLRHGGYAVPAMNIGRYVFIEQFTLRTELLHQLRVLSQCPQKHFLSVYLRRGSPLVLWFNKVTSWLQEGGIVDHWQERLIREGLVTAVELGASSPTDVAANPQPLHTTNIAPAFLLLVIGCAASSVCLCAEMLRVRLPCR